MAQDTFGSLWKALLLRCPDLPSPLAQQFVKFAYRKVLNKHEWGATRAVSAWKLPAVYTTGTVTFTSGSTGVSGSGTNFTVAAHEGLQIRAPLGPWYTITTVTNTTTLVLDRAFVGTTLTGTTFEISRVYVSPASDFKHLISAWNPAVNQRLRKGYAQEYVDAKDPQRAATGEPYIVASAYTNQTTWLPSFELWPRTTAERVISYRYYKEVADPTDSTTIMFPINGELVLNGAIAECAKHPGTTEKPNPYFNMSIAQMAQKEFEDGLVDAIRKDNNIYQVDFYRHEDQMPYGGPMGNDYLVDHDPFFPTY
jgi:hypothetical protein